MSLETDPRSALDDAQRSLADMAARARTDVPDLHDSIETLMNAARAARRARTEGPDRLSAHLEKLENGITGLREALHGVDGGQ